MWRGETNYSIEVHLFDQLGQLSSLALALQARDSAVGRRSTSGSEGVLAAKRAGSKCSWDAGRWRLRWTVSRGEWREKGTHIILSPLSSIEPTTFPQSPSHLEAVNAGRTCVVLGVWEYCHHQHVRHHCCSNWHTRVRQNPERRRKFVVEAFTEVVCGNDVLRGIEPNRSLQRRDTWDGRYATASHPRSPDNWTVCPKRL